jgi:beta-glucosidase
MPPNRIVVELDPSGTADGVLEVSSGQPLCLGEVSGCQSVLGQASDSPWKVAITGRQAGVKQMVELANCRSATDAVTPSLFIRRRHDEFMRRKSEGPVGILFLGDSITDWWPKNGKDTWEKFAPYNPANFGIMAMRTEGLLWNITHGELDGLKPKTTVILIGVNNILQCPDEKPEWVAAGIGKIVATAREKMPDTKIVLMGILPARNPASHPARARIAEVNRLIANLDDGKQVRFLDIGSKFLDADGNVRKDLTSDFLHPNTKGYQIWKDALLPVVSNDATK